MAQKEREDVLYLKTGSVIRGNIKEQNAEKVKDYHPKKLLEVLMVRKLLKSLKPDSKI